jgi:DNA-binding response OmpR family regulator
MSPKILIADDEEDVKTVLQMYLESRGFEIVTAYDGLDAIEQARREMPDAILLDVMMPTMDGFEVCKTLKGEASTQAIPIVMLSAASHAESVQKGLSAGAADYVVKPFEPEHLEKLLKKLLEK